MKIVETELEINKHIHYNAGAETYRKTRDIDNRINSIATDYPPGDFEIIFDHFI